MKFDHLSRDILISKEYKSYVDALASAELNPEWKDRITDYEEKRALFYAAYHEKQSNGNRVVPMLEEMYGAYSKYLELPESKVLVAAENQLRLKIAEYEIEQSEGAKPVCIGNCSICHQCH